MFDLKPLPKESVETALSKVERYRLLNEPWEAESICRDVLAVEPDNQQALVSLLLSITDQFGMESGSDVARAWEMIPQLDGDYRQAYYSGIICERRGKALLRAGAAGTGPVVYDWLRQAMEWYEKAERLRPAGNADSIVRWNTCARIIDRHDHVRPAPEEAGTTLLE